MSISAAFAAAVAAFARCHPTPFPKGLLECGVGKESPGWHMVLNTTNEEIDHIPRFSVLVYWGGLPAGAFNAGGGIIAAGEAANEESFIEWAKGYGVGGEE